MARLKRRLCVAALAAIGAALLTSCASGSEGPAAIYGNPPALQEYQSSLGNLDDLATEGSIFFTDLAAPGDEEYRDLVARYREDGLVALSAVDRESLLLMAQLAFLAHVRTIRYSATANAGSTNPAYADDGRAVLEEVYRQQLVPSVVARRTMTGGMLWGWTAEPQFDADVPAEQLEFYEFDLEEERTSEFATLEMWQKRGSEWTCTRAEAAGDFWAEVHVAHLASFRDYAHGELQGGDSVDGQDAYRFTSTRPPRYLDITYWLDAETLWLRQYEYDEDGIRYTIKLEAVNEDITIEPPDVDVECAEE